MFRANQQRPDSEEFLMELDYAGFEATPVAQDTFPHVVVRNFVPPATLRALVAELPHISKRGSFPPEAVRLGPRARSLVQALEGHELRADPSVRAR